MTSSPAGQTRHETAGPESGGRIVIVIADPRPLVRAGIRGVLEQDRAVVVAAEVADEAGMGHAIRRHAPSVFVADDQIVGSISFQPLCDEFPSMSVVVLADEISDDTLISLLSRRVRAVVDRNGGPHDLIHAVRAASDNATFIASRFAGPLMATVRRLAVQLALEGVSELDTLTPREREVLDLVRQGMTNRGIANSLYLGERTIRFHVSNILSKTGFKTRIQLIAAIARR